MSGTCSVRTEKAGTTMSVSMSNASRAATLVSGTSIAERAREAGLSFTTSEEVAAAARAGDAAARALWDETVEALSCGLISIVNLFEPELVVLGGGVSRAGEQLFAPVRERVRADAMRPAGEAARIVASALGERVGVVGAAAIAYERAEPGDPVARA